MTPAQGGDARPITIIAVIAVVFAFLLIINLGLAQLQSALVIGLIIAGLGMLNPQTAIAVTFIYLAVTGDLRRYLVAQVGVVSNDPLLLVAPIMVVLLMAVALNSRRVSLRTRESKMVLLLMTIMSVEILNPLQGGVVVGAAGALFNLVPLLWFWVGQAWGTPQFVEKLLFRVVVPLAVLASVLGLTQGLYGYLGFEAALVPSHHDRACPTRYATFRLLHLVGGIPLLCCDRSCHLLGTSILQTCSARVTLCTVVCCCSDCAERPRGNFRGTLGTCVSLGSPRRGRDPLSEPGS